jgi:hypothetical protein
MTDKLTLDKIKQIRELMESNKVPDEDRILQVNGETFAAFQLILAEHEKWEEQLFTPSGLSILFPTLRNKKRA